MTLVPAVAAPVPPRYEAPDARSGQLPPFATRLVGTIAGVQLALHLWVLVITPFGVHRDEFLYFSMGRHLRFWRMDFPPLIAVLANASRAAFGDSLASVRVFPALEGVVLVVLAGAIARELGGGRFAQALAALCVVAAPVFLRASTLFQPVVLDQVWWTLGLWALVRLLRTGDARWWWAIGIAMGFGLLTKFSIAFVGVAMVGALVATRDRRLLATPRPWLAAALALAIGSASVIGQLRLGFPVTSQMRDLQESQLTHVTWLSFVAEQLMLVGPVAWLIAVAGAAALVGSRPLVRYRAVGLTCIFAFALLLALHGKAYYAAPIYPTLFAAGAVPLAQLGVPRLAAIVRAAVAVLVVALGAIALPLALPILSPQGTARYAQALGVGAAVRTNRGDRDRLPQDFADMLGWEEQARALRAAYASLSAAEQRQAVIIGGNYGEAGAAEFYSGRYGLPPVVSTAGSFWFFGPGERPGNVAITIGASEEDLRPFFDDVRPAGHVVSPWSVAEERDVRVLIARRPKMTLQAAWPSLAGQD